MNVTDWTYSFEEHEKQQLLRCASWSFSQKLQWLEDAHHLVLEMEKSRNRDVEPQNTPPNHTIE